MSEDAEIPKLVELLDLAEIGTDRFLASTQSRPAARLFGGVLLAQSVAAAGRTVVAGRPVHSMHGMFVRGGRAGEPVEYTVDRIRDGGSTSARRVIARQDGVELYSAMVSFQRRGSGIRHQVPFPDPPPPERYLPLHERLIKEGVVAPDWWLKPRAIDLRHVDAPPYPPRLRAPDVTQHLVWLRTVESLPDDPLLHACALAYASDMTLLEPVLLRHGIDRHAPNVRMASLDHALWFHRDFRADEFLLYDQDCPVADAGRVLGQGTLFDRSGRQIASVVQEALFSLGRR